jgi:hypothetical protein
MLKLEREKFHKILFFGVSIEEINNATMRSSTRFIFWCFH